jgi:hypothetical protein
MMRCFNSPVFQEKETECSLTVEVTFGSDACTAKFLIYEVVEEEEDLLLIEVRRKTGDAVLFVSVFKTLEEYCSIIFPSEPCEEKRAV